VREAPARATTRNAALQRFSVRLFAARKCPLDVLFGLVASQQIRLRRIKDFRDIEEKNQEAACKKRYA